MQHAAAISIDREKKKVRMKSTGAAARVTPNDTLLSIGVQVTFDYRIYLCLSAFGAININFSGCNVLTK